jgi:hypothetical protein
MSSPGDSSLRKTKRKPPSKPRGGRWRCETRHLRSHHRAVHRAVEKRNRALAETLIRRPRLDRAHLHPSLRQGGRRVLAAPAFGTAANQRTFKDDPRPGRLIERAVSSASVPSQLGGFTMRRPAFSPTPWQNFAPNALNCGHCLGRRALRVLDPSAIADAAIQPNFPESSGFVRPFFPSSPSHKPRLRAKRKGGGICFDLSSGVLGNQFRGSLNHPARRTGLSYLRVRFPGSNDRQECTFPGGKCERAAFAQFPAVPARVRHASEGVTFFQTHQQQTKIKRMPRNQKPGTARIDLDITAEAHLRFAAIHKALGFKTKTETFEALVFSISAKDVIDPGVMERLETKLDQALEAIDSLT